MKEDGRSKGEGVKGYGSPGNKGEWKKRRKAEVTKENGSDEGGQKTRRRTEVMEEEGDAGGVYGNHYTKSRENTEC